MATKSSVPTAVLPTPESVPMFTYPPFPPVPEGVTIISFKDFKPSGIKKFLDPSADDVELDGIGVPTAQLQVKHAGPDSDKWKKKKKRMGEDDNGVVKRYYWWEEWEKDETGRKITEITDPNTTHDDRLIQAANDFQAGRPWPPALGTVHALFDTFRLYVGLLAQPPQSSKKRSLPDVSDEENSDEDTNSMDCDPKDTTTGVYVVRGPQVGGGAKKNSPPPAPTDNEEQDEEANERREARIDAFLDDPETTLSVFFSSPFRNKGLIWSEKGSRDGPLVLEFFIAFLLRNNVFPDSSVNDRLRDALNVAQLAKKELPASFGIARSLPDAFSKGCQQLWGSKIEIIILNATPIEPEKSRGGSMENEQSESKRRKIADNIDSPGTETLAQVEEQKIDMETVESSGLTTWGEAADLEPADSGGWGTNGGDAPVDGNNGWGEGAPNDQTPWDKGATWDIGDVPSLTKSLGPTSLPLTHTTGIVESSTRKITAILPPCRSGYESPTPAEAVEADLNEKFGKVVLAPWIIDWDNHDKSDIIRAEILPKSRGAVVDAEQDTDVSMGRPSDDNSAKPHDPFKDEITVFVDPSVLEKLVGGMGITATWIQVARTNQDGEPVTGAPSIWYLEQVLQIIPSFYIDP